MKSKKIIASDIIDEAVKFYVDGCGSIPDDVMESGVEITTGTGLEFNDLIHPSRWPVSVMLKELYKDESELEDDIDDLTDYECEMYALHTAEKYTRETGEKWDYGWDSEVECSFGVGAWVVKRK